MAEQDNFEEDLFADLYVYAQTGESFLVNDALYLPNARINHVNYKRRATSPCDAVNSVL